MKKIGFIILTLSFLYSPEALSSFDKYVYKCFRDDLSAPSGCQIITYHTLSKTSLVTSANTFQGETTNPLERGKVCVPTDATLIVTYGSESSYPVISEDQIRDLLGSFRYSRFLVDNQLNQLTDLPAPKDSYVLLPMSYNSGGGFSASTSTIRYLRVISASAFASSSLKPSGESFSVTMTEVDGTLLTATQNCHLVATEIDGTLTNSYSVPE